jgi:exosortase/archaeosortase family protein
MVAFVAIFLGVTLGILFGYQALAGTSYLGRYLFLVAGHTSWVLGYIGDESTLEGHFNDRGKEVQIRDNIALWMRGEVGPAPRRQVDGDQDPITRWEHYLNRIITAGWEKDDAQERFDMLVAKASAPLQADSLDSLENVLRERHTVLNASLTYTTFRFITNDAGEEELTERSRKRGPRPIVKALDYAADELDRLESEPAATEAERSERLMAIHASLQGRTGDIATHFLAVTTERAEWADDMGPVVDYVHDGGLLWQAATIQRELTKIRRDESLSEEDRETRNTELKAQRRAIRDQQAALKKQDEVALAEANVGKEFKYRIIASCGAIEAMAIFLAAVLAFPTRWRARLAGIAMGLPLLYAVNIFRLSCLAVIGAHTTHDTFQFYHQVVWQGIYLLFVVFLWLVWMEVLVRPTQSRKKVKS